MARLRARSLPLAALAVLAASAASAQSVTFLSTSAYGTFEAAGVVATVSGDANRNAAATLEWRPAGAGAFRLAHPLVRISDTTFAGSLFWLTPGTSYDVRVTLADPDGVAGTNQRTTTFATRADSLPEPTLRTLYVAPSGDDDNTGTDALQPLRTLQRAADLARAGDLVSIAPGIYRESVVVPASGTATQPIVFRGSAPGVVLDGADAGIAGGTVVWTPQASGIYSTSLAFDTGHVVTDQGRLFRYDSLGDLAALPTGAPGGFYYGGAGKLYLKLPGGASPAARQVNVARLDAGFDIEDQSFVRVENVEIRHYGSGDYGKGVYLRYASDCVVRGVSIHEVEAAGVWIKGGSRNLVEDSDFGDTSISGWPWDWSKGSSAENNGVVMTDDVGRGNVVRRNHFHDTFNGIGPCGGLEPPDGAITVETDVYDNWFTRHDDDALEPEGWCSNVRMWGNTITDSHMAFSTAPAAPGPTWIVRNVAYDFGNTRSSQIDGYTASALKINSDYDTPIGPLFLYHNTFVTSAPGTDAIALLDPGESTFVRARDNVFAGAHYALYKINPVLLDWDWDDLVTTDASRYVWWEGTRYDTLPALRAGTGEEQHGSAVAPLLVDPAHGSFGPRNGSPLIDAGIPIAGIDDGWTGTAPDLGAIEWELLRDGFESGDTTRWSASRP